MAFDARSDVVLDVLKAADPMRAAAATQRLTAIASGSERGAAAFSATLDSASSAGPSPAPPSPVEGAANARSRLGLIGASNPAAKARMEFEAVMLNSFVSEMMPKDAEATFGQGLAGDMWKSMLADQVARQIAKSGALGLDRQLFGARDFVSRLDSARQNEFAAPAAQASANALSRPAAAPEGETSLVARKNVT